jgi:hypothetical protein
LSAIVPDREVNINFIKTSNRKRQLKLLNISKNKITFKYMKEAYKKSLEDSNYVTTEGHRKLQHDFLKKYGLFL